MHKAQTGQILATFARISRRAFTNIIWHCWIGLETNTMFALVVLARWRLWVHHCNHWSSLTEFARILFGTLALVIVDTVHTGSTILTHMTLAIVNVLGTIGTPIAGRTVACVVRKMINTLSSVDARIKVSRTEWNLCFAESTWEAGLAVACIRFDAIYTCSVIKALICRAIIDVYFAPGARVAGSTLATEASLLQDSAGSIVPARMAIARINHMLAVLAMVAWLAHAFILTFRSSTATGIVLARERKAGIAFRKNFIADAFFTLEAGRRCREKELITHSFGLSTTGNARFDIVKFYPVREPLEWAVTVQRITSERNMCDRLKISERTVRDHRDLVAVKRKNAEVFQTSETMPLDALKLIVADYST